MIKSGKPDTFTAYVISDGRVTIDYVVRKEQGITDGKLVTMKVLDVIDGEA